MDYIFSQFVLVIILLTTIFLHTAKKDSFVVTLYCIQSCAISILLFKSAFETDSSPLLVVAFLTFIIKALVAPRFFTKLIKKHELKFSSPTYLNAPLTLIMITALTVIAHAQVFSSLTTIVPANKGLLSLTLAIMLISLLLLINRKEAISQMTGILSLENGIVAFAIFSGLDQSPGLQIGIMFDIALWLIIATIFTSMIYKHFRSLDVTTMKHLKE